MGEVISFPKPKTPSMPAWRRELWEQWNNPSNWGDFGDSGALRFSWGPRFAAFLYPQTEEPYCGYWSFTVFDGPASGAVSEYVWRSADDAELAAWAKLIKMVEKRERAARRHRHPPRSTPR
jgi:hypothetical protein